jgi:micrococcal nuclease
MQLRAIPLLGLAVSLSSEPADAATCPRGNLTGEVTYVWDGDTIVVGSMPIRLNGLAAPEGDEPGGAAAAHAMLDLVDGRELRCELNGERTHDRCVGICSLEAEDISEIMTHRGVARDLSPLQSGDVTPMRSDQAAAEGATIGRIYPLPGYCQPR